MLTVWLALIALGVALGCNRRSVDDLVVLHLDSNVNPKCQANGQQCKYDRNCCPGFECKMDLMGRSIVATCQPRQFYEDYKEFMGNPSWKDYQEVESPEDDGHPQQNLNVEMLEKRNKNLRLKLIELEFLRKNLRRQRLSDTKKKLEEEELNELKRQQLQYEKEFDKDVERLRKREKMEKLEELMKKEVNSTLSKQRRVADIYMNMLTDLVNNEGGFNKN